MREKTSYTHQQNMVDEPLALLQEDKLRPPKEVLDQIMKGLM